MLTHLGQIYVTVSRVKQEAPSGVYDTLGEIAIIVGFAPEDDR